MTASGPPSSSFWKTLIINTLIILTAGSIGVIVRLYPLRHHISFDSSEKATVLVIANLRKRVNETIERNFPNLTPSERHLMAKKQFDQLLHEGKDQFFSTVGRVAREIDQNTAPHQKYPYLLASDSYYYYELTKNIEKTGKLSETIRGSKYFHPLMLAPEGHWEPLNLHPYVGYFIYKILTFFHPSLPLMYAVSYTPLVIFALTLIPFLGICRLMNIGWPVSLLGMLFLQSAPIYLRRSMFGWYDNDPYNVLFPLLILWLIFSAERNRQRLKTAALWTGAAALAFSVYALFWHGWMFLLIIVTGGILLTAGFERWILKNRDAARQLTPMSGGLILFTFSGITLFFGFDQFFILFDEGYRALKNFIEPAYSLWPDIYLGVGELKKTSPASLTELMGGWVMIFLSIGGVICGNIALARRRASISPFIVITMTVFLGLALVMALGAMRFALLFLTPAALTAVWGLQALSDGIHSQLRMRLPTDRWKTFRLTVVPALLTTLIALWPIRYATIMTPNLLNPLFNDTWEDALLKIRDNTPENSIVNTWWAPGHFIKAIARRGVSFDGASINSPQSYWMATILLSPDEKKALGLLRMLNASGNRAAVDLTGQGWKLSTSVDLIKSVTALNKDRAQKILLDRGFPPEEGQRLLALTHPPPRPTYLLIYNEMIDKQVQFSYVGKWDIAKMEELNADPLARSAAPRPNSPNYVPFIWELAGGAPKYSGVLTPIISKNNTLVFDQGVTIDLTRMTVSVDSPTFGRGVPLALIYQENSRLITQPLPGASLGYTAVLFRKNNAYSCALMDMELAQSLLMKLYFFDGAGFRFIKPFYETADLSGRTKIKIFEVNWKEFLTEL